jgi:hemerythrin-like domain-containing protein
VVQENIITIIKDDHKELKEGILILTNENSKPSLKKSALRKFLTDLKLHSKSEESSLYDNLVDRKTFRDSILEGYEEHAVADLLADELEASQFEKDFTDELQAKAKVLAELVKHHVEEEEEQLLSSLDKALSPEDLISLGEAYKLMYLDLTKEMTAYHKRIKPDSDRTMTY